MKRRVNPRVGKMNWDNHKKKSDSNKKHNKGTIHAKIIWSKSNNWKPVVESIPIETNENGIRHLSKGEAQDSTSSGDAPAAAPKDTNPRSTSRSGLELRRRVR